MKCNHSPKGPRGCTECGKSFVGENLRDIARQVEAIADEWTKIEVFEDGKIFQWHADEEWPADPHWGPIAFVTWDHEKERLVPSTCESWYWLQDPSSECLEEAIQNRDVSRDWGIERDEDGEIVWIKEIYRANFPQAMQWKFGKS
jgi:hypothetical protein